MATGKLGNLNILEMGDSNDPPAYTKIANVMDVEGINASNEALEITDQDSVAAEFIPGLVDYGDVTFTINYDVTDVTHDPTVAETSLWDAFKAATKRKFKLKSVAADDRMWTFDAVITALSESRPVKGVRTASVTLKISGAPTASTIS